MLFIWHTIRAQLCVVIQFIYLFIIVFIFSLFIDFTDDLCRFRKVTDWLTDYDVSYIGPECFTNLFVILLYEINTEIRNVFGL
jgi:hypothetical protein